jgi:hypothetical protein
VSFAEGTTVSVEKTQFEIAALVKKYGAAEFSSGWMNSQAAIQFLAKGRRVRFVLDLPDHDWAVEKLFNKPRSRFWSKTQITSATANPVVEAECRRRWRCLLLAIKAKLEVVESGIASFDEEFLAHIVIDDRTVMDHIREMQGSARPLLPAVGS